MRRMIEGLLHLDNMRGYIITGRNREVIWPTAAAGSRGVFVGRMSYWIEVTAGPLVA